MTASDRRQGSAYAHRIVHLWGKDVYQAHRGESDGRPCLDTIGSEDRLLDIPGLADGEMIEPGSTFVYVMALSDHRTYLLGGFPYEHDELGSWGDWGDFRMYSAPEHASIFRSDVIVPLDVLEEIVAWRGRGAKRERRPLVFVTDVAGRPVRLSRQTMRHPTLLASGWAGLDALLDWG